MKPQVRRSDRVTVAVREDRSVGGGGYAVIHIPGALLPSGDVEMRVRRIGFDRSNLGPDGWQAPEAMLVPRSVAPTSDGLEIGIGPEVVDRISFGTPVEIEIPALGLRSVLHWPDIPPSVGDTSSARTRVLAVEPSSPEQTDEGAAEPALEDRPLRATRDGPAFIDPTRVYGWAPDAEGRGRRRWPWVAGGVVVVAALVWVLVAGGGQLAENIAGWLEGPQEPETQTAVVAPDPGADPGATAPEAAEPETAQPAVVQPTEPSPPPEVAPPPTASVVAAPGRDIAAIIAGAGSPFDIARQLRDIGLPPQELFDHASQLLEDGQTDTALLLLQMAEQANHAPAMREIGRMYDPLHFERGRTAFAQPNPAEAARLYGIAAEQGDAAAAANRAALKDWVTERAGRGDPDMQTLLREEFDGGEG